MKRVIIRDDDTNPLMPVPYLERLYRPFLDRGLPVNLATIPYPSTSASLPDGTVEGFLMARTPNLPSHVGLKYGVEVVEYLKANPGYELLHHGWEHTYLEFNRKDPGEIRRRLEHGAREFEAAGFTPPRTFVAPYDQISREAYVELSKRFDIISTGWFELGRIPLKWLPAYLLKKAQKRRHWNAGQLRLLSHPGCLLSYHRPLEGMLESVRRAVASQPVTVLVTHWWEYFYKGVPNEPFIEILHQVAEMLSKDPTVQVIRFSELASVKDLNQE